MQTNLDVTLLCGEVGVGKTTLALKKWPSHVLLKGDDTRNQYATMGALENALSDKFDKQYLNTGEIFFDLRTILKNDVAIILDQVELIDEIVIKAIINTAISIKRAVLVFIFDLNSQVLIENRTFRFLLDNDILSQPIEVTASKDDLQTVLTSMLPHAERQWCTLL